jgi:phage-related protein
MMSTIGSVSSAQTNYEVNAKAYGPVVAGTVGIVEAAGDAVSAVCSFSAESLSKLGDAAESGLDSIGAAFSDVTDVVGDAIDSAEAGVTQLYTEVANLTKEGMQAIGDAASSAVDGISSAAGSVGVAATVSVAAGKA